MKFLAKSLSTFVLLALSSGLGHSDDSATRCIPGMDQDIRKLHSSKSPNPCAEFSGRPTLNVSTASHCGFTPQFKVLESIHSRYADRGLVVKGFPSDDIHQAADNEEKAAEVCYINYGVSSTVFAPTRVKRSEVHPVFKYLARESQASRWNFTKYLVSGSGEVTHRFGSNVTPDSPPMNDAIESLL